MRYSFLFVSFRFEFIVNRSKRNIISSLYLSNHFTHILRIKISLPLKEGERERRRWDLLWKDSGIERDGDEEGWGRKRKEEGGAWVEGNV